jgi:hypothetical protein
MGAKPRRINEFGDLENLEISKETKIYRGL